VSTVSLLRFTSITDVFSNFTNPDDYSRFFKRMQQYGSFWGLLDTSPGHVRYDMWWDIPHEDVAGRHFDKWEVRPGG
jgi:hypothetical protein